MAEIFNILIVDDSKSIVHYLLDILSTKDHNLLYTFSKEEAKKIITQNEVDILICDLMLPALEDGLQTVKFFKKMYPHSKVLGISANSSLDNVVAVIKEGADDFVAKNSTKDQIIKKIESLKSLVGKMNGKIPDGASSWGDDIIVGKSASMLEVMNRMKIVAQSEVETCLIVGESGTGKELVARNIHCMSRRKKMPFLALNCAGMPDALIDSELFGFERGSFTGAYNTSQGKFELADKGVLFLDEISEMPVHLQGKLLRVLENREVLRIGGKKTIPIDVMILAATNRNLDHEIREKKFRDDIFYRLNMVKIEIPPLHERKEDIPLLADYFLKIVNKKLAKSLSLDKEILGLLTDYSFPGNVRELKNMIYSSALFCQGNIIQGKDMEPYLTDRGNIPDENLSSNRKGQMVSLEQILKVLKKHGGNITASAVELGYTREGLSRKLKRMNIDIDSF